MSSSANDAHEPWSWRTWLLITDSRFPWILWIITIPAISGANLLLPTGGGTLGFTAFQNNLVVLPHHVTSCVDIRTTLPSMATAQLPQSKMAPTKLVWHIATMQGLPPIPESLDRWWGVECQEKKQWTIRDHEQLETMTRKRNTQLERIFKLVVKCIEG
jgi:hypothetical protein